LTGEALALLAAFSFGLSSVAIAKGAQTSGGQSGVFLSAIMTGLLAGSAWLIFDYGSQTADSWPTALIAIAWFVASGVLATIGGRLTMFKSIEFAGVIRASTTRRLMPLMSLFLGWLILSEQVSGLAGTGMALIAASFLLLYWDNRAKLKISTDDPAQRSLISRGLAFGVVSAFLYATSFIARKFGLVDLPSAFFGALIGALTAIFYYAAAATVSREYRSIVAGALKAPNPWQLLAAFLMSVGQIAQFGALMHTGAGRVAFINSVEVYISAFLAVIVFKTEPMPGRSIFIAMVLATVGVVLMAL